VKRLFDTTVALVSLALCTPLILAAAMLIKIDSPGPVFFRQRRIGRAFRPFDIYKFRTMRADAEPGGELLTVARDPRITRVGRVLRETKIDELPQLINVLKGDMSLVGPRPEVDRYVDLFRTEYREILSVRPGITDLASLKYRDESALLAQATSPELEYVTCILPDKLRLGREYIERSSLLFDLAVIGRTLAAVVRGAGRVDPASTAHRAARTTSSIAEQA